MILTATINEVKRRVTFDNPNAVVAVKGDYEVNGVAFVFPAIYEDDFDLSTAVKTVYYKATDGIIYNHVVTDTDTDTGYPLWVFKDEINKGAYGDVEFALVCDKVEGGNIVKRWVSMITAFRVQRSIEIDEAAQEDNEQTYSERLAYLMTQVANMQTSVTTASESASAALTKANAVDERLDNIIIESGTSEAEVVAARTNSDTGTTYNTLGARLDTEYSEIKEDLSTKTGLSEEAKQALLTCFAHVAWVDEHGQDYYDALEEALYPPANISRIEAVYSAKGMPLEGDSTDTLKSSLTVTARYTDGTSQTVENYALTSTSLASGVNTLIVSYAGKTTQVEVTALSTDLPSGFQRVEYIENDASAISKHDVETTAFIDVGLYFANNTDDKEYLVDYERTSIATDTRYVMACGLANNAQYSVGYAVGLDPSIEKIYAFSGSTAVIPDSYLLNNRYKIYSKLTSGNVYIEDKNTGSSGNIEGTTRDCYNRMITLFGQGKGQTTASTRAKYAISGRIYSAQVLEGGTLKACLLPCRNTSTEEIGVYDIVRNRFIAPKSSATFSVGADI